MPDCTGRWPNELIKPDLRTILRGGGILSLVILVIFGDVIVQGGHPILSLNSLDLQVHLLTWREFGFSQLRTGNFPLWNPYSYSGMPYFSELQSALLYPINLILYLLFSSELAVNLEIILHIFAAGFFTYLWLVYNKISPLSSVAAAIMLMLSGPHYLHLIPGHLPNLCAMTWVPLLLLSLDFILAGYLLRGFLVCTSTLVLLILSGHPQYLFYSLVVGFLYFIIFLALTRHRIMKTSIYLLSHIAAFLLCAIQLVPSFETFENSTRAGGLTSQLAGTFSLAPENLITLVVPRFFANWTEGFYWGRFYDWEMNVYIGGIGLLFAIFGSVFGEPIRRKRISTLIIICFIFAFSTRIPGLNQILSIFPVFNVFRGSSKFIYFITLLAARLVGTSLDAYFAGLTKKRTIILVTAALVIAISSLTLGFSIRAADSRFGETTWVQNLIQKLLNSGETYYRLEPWALTNFVRTVSRHAFRQCLISATWFTFLAMLLGIASRRKYCHYLLVLFLGLELCYFARGARPTFDSGSVRRPELSAITDGDPGDYRIMDFDYLEAGLIVKKSSIWGFDPLVSRRYAEFIAYTQGIDPDHCSQHIAFTSYHRLYKLLRCRYWFERSGGDLKPMKIDDTLPRFLFVAKYEVLHHRDAILQRMNTDDFDCRATVILEEIPDPQPTSGAPGSLRVNQRDFDDYELEIELEHPSILVITDPYAKGWQVEDRSKSTQGLYRLLPADYIVQAVPMTAGFHQLRVRYVPPGIKIGILLSVVGCVIMLLVGSLLVKFRLTTLR